MSVSNPAAPRPHRACGLSWAEAGFLLFLLAAGYGYLRDAPFWGRNAYVGTAQFGDAEFWWNGALHFAQGIIAENPNLNYRMGYAAFGGVVAAALGPDYRVFHQLLVAVFLGSAGALYLSWRSLIGRAAAAGAVLLLVFNPYTAEWLAISTSDALGLVLNLLAVVALAAGVRDGLRPRGLALFGIFLACASLTRPLMTPFIVPAAMAVIAIGGAAWRRTARALTVMLTAFVLPTLAWMGFMAATTGNFALTGASQDSSAFYAASDPQIQVWRPDMYAAVNAAAQKRHHTERPSAQQLNAEFWTQTRANYGKHWRFHTERFARNLMALATFTPARATAATAANEKFRRILQWTLTITLGVLALRRRRQWPAIAVFFLGGLWALQPAAGPWLVLAGGTAGIAALFFRRPGVYLWAAYWWVGIAALYLTGGTWGPPLGAGQDLNALGYRLGFQFFFATDLLVVGLLGTLGLGGRSGDAFPEEAHPLLRPSMMASRLGRGALLLSLGVLAAILGTGTVIVIRRLVARSHATAVPYPDPAALASWKGMPPGKPLATMEELGAAIAEHKGTPLSTRGMSSGFIWNLPGQERSMLLIYQQDHVRPVTLSPRQLYVETSRHLPERSWMARQGLWVLRSFPDTAQTSNLPYYFEMPAVQSFVPLAPDGKSYDREKAVVFPLAKTATQLAADGELKFIGAQPEWSSNSGTLRFPRRFALRATAAGPAIGWRLDLSHARGERSVRFDIQFEGTNAADATAAVRLETPEGALLWEGNVGRGPTPIPVHPDLPAGTTALWLTTPPLLPGDTLWFYELVLQADDFTQ